MARMKRSHLKRFSASTVKAGRQPNSQWMQEYNARVARDDGKVMALIGLVKYVANAPRVAVVERLKELLEDVDPILHFALINSKYKKVLLFHNAKGDRYFFISKDMILGELMRSIIYPSRQHAMNVWGRNKVTWTSRTPLPAEPLPG